MDIQGLPIGLKPRAVGETQTLVGETQTPVGEAQIAVGEAQIAVGEAQIAVGEAQIAVGETQIAVGETCCTPAHRVNTADYKKPLTTDHKNPTVCSKLITPVRQERLTRIFLY